MAQTFSYIAIVLEYALCLNNPDKYISFANAILADFKYLLKSNRLNSLNFQYFFNNIFY